MRELETSLTQFEALKLAKSFVTDNIGQTPVPRAPTLEKDVWVIPLDVCYPKMIFDAETHLPKTRRFLYFKELATLKVSAKTGKVLSYPDAPEMNSIIRNKLDNVRERVEEAITKVAAYNLAKVPFAAHMASPIEDIIATVILRNEFNLTALKNQSDDDQRKYGTVKDLLCEVNLLQEADNFLTRGPAFIELEQKWENEGVTNIAKQFEEAIGYVFSVGYMHHKTISTVLGTYLDLCGLIYENSLENDRITPILYDDLERSFQMINASKIMKLDRYTVQLTDVGMIDSRSKKWKKRHFSKCLNLWKNDKGTGYS